MARPGSLAYAHDALLPSAPQGLGRGAALALLVHAALLAALTVSVDWRTRAPEPVSAELWSGVPQAAAPRSEATAPAPAPAPPPPAPPAPVVIQKPAPAPPPVVAPPAPRPAEPDIAIEQEKKRQADLARQRAAEQAAAVAERAAQQAAEKKAAQKKLADAQRAEAEKAERAEKVQKAEKAEAEKARREQAAREKEAAAARSAKADEERAARIRAENLKRIIGAADSATGRVGSAVQDSGPSASYAAKVDARIRPEIHFSGDVPETASTEVLVRTGPGGSIIAATVTKKSGYKEWDDAVLRAIDKAGTLPRDGDGRVPSTLLISFTRGP